MANTYTQLYVQIVFAVKYREALLSKEWREQLNKYITGVVQNKGSKLLAIGGVADHIHIFVGLNPTQSLSDLVRDVKRSSSLWVNENHYKRAKFSWQEGFGAFSYSRSQIGAVVKYIERQEEHHRKASFRDEYVMMLKKFEIEYDEKYVFKELI